MSKRESHSVIVTDGVIFFSNSLFLEEGLLLVHMVHTGEAQALVIQFHHLKATHISLLLHCRSLKEWQTNVTGHLLGKVYL